MSDRSDVDCFLLQDEQAEVVDGGLRFGNTFVPVRNGIPRFTPDASYSANFALLREKHASLQLDSANGTTDRRDTLLRRTAWPAEFFAGKHVLECGCGAGPDTEILLALNARTLSVDLAGLDTAKANLKDARNARFVQADITDLPLKERHFDIVFCHRVLQHTPDPKATLRHILRFVKPDGAVFIHSYSSSWFQRVRWKYALLPITNKLQPETLYRLIRLYSKPAFRLTNFTGRSRIGRHFNRIFVPFLNYRHLNKFRNMTDHNLLEYAIHDTFDALSPRYDKPIGASRMKAIASRRLQRAFEVIDDGKITILRTLPSALA